MTQHDFTNPSWGHAASWRTLYPGRIKGHLFTAVLNVDDTILLRTQSGVGTYRVAEIPSNPADPGDMWFFEAERIAP